MINFLETGNMKLDAVQRQISNVTTNLERNTFFCIKTVPSARYFSYEATIYGRGLLDMRILPFSYPPCKYFLFVTNIDILRLFVKWLSTLFCAALAGLGCPVRSTAGYRA
jgi:hypothetical protein